MDAMNTMNTMLAQCGQAGDTVSGVRQWLGDSNMADRVHWCDGLVGHNLRANVLGEAGVAGGTVRTVCDGQWGLVSDSDGLWLSIVSQ